MWEIALLYKINSPIIEFETCMTQIILSIETTPAIHNVLINSRQQVSTLRWLEEKYIYNIYLLKE